MRKRNLATFAFTLILTGSTACAQSETNGLPQPVTIYAWRAPTLPPTEPTVLAAQYQTTDLSSQQNGLAQNETDQLGWYNPMRTAEIRSAQPGFHSSDRGMFNAPPRPLRVALRQDEIKQDLLDSQPSISDQPVFENLAEASQSPNPSTFTRPATVSDLPPAAAKPVVGTDVESLSESEPALAKKTTTSEFSKDIPFNPKTETQLPARQPPLGVQDAGDPIDPNYCSRDCRPNFCNLGCEKKLFGRNCNGLEIGGWTQLGYHNRNNIIFNDRKAEANLHQQWLYFDKQAGVTSNWGYRADMLYGVDAQNTQAFGNAPVGAPSGWDNGWDNGAYGWALPQLYVQYDNSLWDVKIGKFFSPFGYEVVAAPQNFFYSHSYTMNFTEPFTMTGIVGERQMTDSISSIFGATVGWDTGFERAAGGFNLITGTRFQPNDSVNLALTTSLGDTGYRDSGTLTSAVAQLKLTDSIDYAIQGDVLNLRKNNEFGIVQYLFREVTPCLKLGTRLEWWKSDQLFDNTKSTYEFTLGANYRANANLTLRPELRFDWGAAAIDPGTPIIGIDAVLTY